MWRAVRPSETNLAKKMVTLMLKQLKILFELHTDNEIKRELFLKNVVDVRLGTIQIA